MKNIIVFIIGLLIGWLVSSAFLKNAESVTSSSLHEGRADTVYIKGETDTLIIDETSYNKETLTAEKKFDDSTLFEKKIIFEDSLPQVKLNQEIDLNIITYPACDSIKLDWNRLLTIRGFDQKDTIKIFRIDTLMVNVEKPRMFYDNFETGLAVGSTIFTIIFLLLNR